MNVLLVKSNKLGSRLIRWGLGEPASHMAVEFPDAGVVYHAYGHSILRVARKDFNYILVDKIVLRATAAEDCDMENFFRSATTYQKYDYPALLYFAWRVFLKRYLGRPFPRVAAWNVPDWSICTELGYLIGEAYARSCGQMILPEGYDLAIVSPWQLGNLLKSRVAQLNASQNPFR